MELGHLFEAMMLVCFGFSWPLNVVKAYKARTAKGTSLAFIILIITGYVAGIAAKFINHQLNYVLVVYFLNLVIVLSNVVVYFRNVALDKRAEVQKSKKLIFELKQKHQKDSVEEISKEENMNFHELNSIAKKNGMVVFGGSTDALIPVTELAASFEFGFEIYNRSKRNLSVKKAAEAYTASAAALEPESVILHVGEEDVALFKNSSGDFDKYYMDLVAAVKASSSKVSLAFVSINNPQKNETINAMNAHIKAIADSERAVFINLDNAKLWNPKAIKAAGDFVYSMGLGHKKPIRDAAEILYSYACLEITEEDTAENLVG